MSSNNNKIDKVKNNNGWDSRGSSSKRFAFTVDTK